MTGRISCDKAEKLRESFGFSAWGGVITKKYQVRTCWLGERQLQVWVE